MPYSITTKDGITIQNIPDDVDPQSDVLRQRVAAIREGQDASIDPTKEAQAEDDSLTLGETLRGGANLAVAGIAKAGEGVIEGLSELGGLALGTISERTPQQSIESAQALTEAIPDVPIGEDAKKLINTISEKFNASPQLVQNIVNEFSNLGSSLGDTVLEKTGSPLLATGARILPEALEAVAGVGALKRVPAAASKAAETAAKIPAAADVATEFFQKQSPTKQKIAQLIKEGSDDAETAGFKLAKSTKAGSPRIQTDDVAKEALKQGFDEGVIATVKGASSTDKNLMKKMVDITKRGKKNARFAAKNRPSDVLGDSLMRRVNVIHAANREAGKSIDDVAASLKGKPADISSAVSGFGENLDKLGVKIIPDGKGGFKPDFELSRLSPGDRGPIREVVRQMNIHGSGDVDFLSAHNMKRAIDNNVTFGKSKTGISREAESALKEFRTQIDDALDAGFPAYNRVNEAYSETISAIDSLQTIAGKRMDLSGPNVDKATGTLLRRVLSNAPSRVELLDSINQIEKTAEKFKGFVGKLDPRAIEGPKAGPFKDDILNQILFVDELESMFGIIARTSLAGEVKKGAAAATGLAAEASVSPVTATVKAGAGLIDKARGINQENAFRSISELLRQ